LRLLSFGGYGLAHAALALVLFGTYDSYPYAKRHEKKIKPKSTSNKATVFLLIRIRKLAKVWITSLFETACQLRQ